MKGEYITVFRRKRERKTDYKKRRAAVVSKLPLLNVFLSSKYVYAHIVKPEVQGDKIISSANSQQLRRLGWMGSGKSIPACYLTGLLLAKRTKLTDMNDVIVYTGMLGYRSGSRIAAVVKGAKDGGLKVLADEESFPEDERISGKHISDYANALKNRDENLYLSKFSARLNAGLRPENIQEHFQLIKQKILELPKNE
ncbi:MAG: 50S ribosomal protein L18 [Nitrososphaerota archaeon]